MKTRPIAFLPAAAVLLGGCFGTPADVTQSDAPYDDDVAVSTAELTFVAAGRLPVAKLVRDPGYYVPTYSDLQLDGTMRYYGGGTPTLGLQIDVTNRGNAPAYGPSGRVSVAGVVLSAALYQYYGGSATQANTVNPNERGYIKVEVPATLLTSCQSYTVQIDLDHTMQAGDSSAFTNDSGSVSTICPLGWSTPIDTRHLGHVPDPLIAGKSLRDIVSSVVSARSDGLLCSSCHNAQSGGNYAYRPNVAPNVASSPIDPFMFIGGDQGWACGSNPWAQQFIHLSASVTPKPEYLKEAFQKWLNDGGAR